ncbi:hypothetical protein SAMN05216327_104269 [Dyadobacter sp. SG02]|nr:hypothetical protein SAMN05216327_104269 [Dyadobacter sp. SG02]
MSTYGYTFIREIESFRLDNYVPHMGWISSFPMPIKIYTKEGEINHFLHDEELDRLFEFSYDRDTHIKESYEYQNFVTAYYLQFPRNADR